jgi:hypothetical protein
MEQAISAFLWFLLGFWIGASAGFMIFAFMRMTRNSDVALDRLLRRRHAGPGELDLEATNY